MSFETAIKRTPKRVLKNVVHGIILNFLKGESVSIFDDENKGKKKRLHKIQVERYILDKDENLKLLDKLNLEPIYEID